MKKRLLSLLGPQQKRTIKTALARLRSFPCRRNLVKLATIHNTDKLSHGYLPIYQRHFQRLRHKKITLLEIGVGGEENPWAGGESLRMWSSFFYRGHIFGVDIADKRPHAGRRITILQGDQSDPEFLGQLTDLTRGLDIIIDDGSHFCDHVITSFEALFPHLKTGGIYVIEDTQTSYWQACGGSMEPTAPTTMNFFKALADGLNHAEYPLADYAPSALDLTIVAIHFYHNLIVIEKGANTLASNVALHHRQAAAGAL